VTARRLILRSLVYFRAAHAALLAGMVLVTAVLTGALILGDSVDSSLRALATRRRGNYEMVVTAPWFFSQSLAAREQEYQNTRFDSGLVLPGRARSESTTLSTGVQLLAIPNAAEVPAREAWITRTVADSLGVQTGDALTLTLAQANPTADAVLLRRDRSTLGSLRVQISRILDDRSTQQPEALLAWFDLHPTQRAPANIWLNLPELQAALQADIPHANRIPQSPANIMLAAKAQPEWWKNGLKLEDYGLETITVGREIILRSGNIYIPPQFAPVLHPLKATGQEVYTLLLDRVQTTRPNAPELSYVIATGITGRDDLGLKDDQVAVNQWTADQLSLKVGDPLQVSPYRLVGDSIVAAPLATFTVARILPMTDPDTRIIPMTDIGLPGILPIIGADPTLTPTFHGLTDADTIANWDPPAGFPFDRARVTAADEKYWNQHRAAPKLFFNLITAQRLVKPQTTLSPTGDSNGELTSLRLPIWEKGNLQLALLYTLKPSEAGFIQRPFAPEPTASTDFTGLFLGLSGFLLIAALLLVVLLFRLAVEQRARQLGLLGALGFTPRRIARFIFLEGALVALLGTLIGRPAALAYTRLLVAGLGTWWIGATGTHILELHVRGATVATGGAVSLLTALLALAWTARRMSRNLPLAQLQGLTASVVTRAPAALRRPRGRTPLRVLALLLAASAITPLLLSATGVLDAPIAFLLAGFLLLILAVGILAALPDASRRVRQTLLAIAAAGIFRQRTRAALCVALMAASSFLLTSVTAFQSSSTAPTQPPSPTGGYQLLITTQIPLPADPQTPAGRKLLGIPEDPLFTNTRFTPLLVQPGDDISCLNMTRPTSATLVGVPSEVLSRLAIAQASYTTPKDAIPAAVDQQTAQYILHAGLGQPVPQTATGQPIIIQTLLTDSIFQSYALIPESDFRRSFPNVTRSSLILVDCPPTDVPALQRLLRTHLDDFGVIVETPAQRLAAYHAVADSYITAFQLLGGLALLVGTLGLVVVLARNVIQRRAELALLQALGFARSRITLLLVLEHGLLLIVGLALGTLTALLATAPQIRQVHPLPVAAAIAIILAAGLIVLASAARFATRQLTPSALRQE
jgi:putative ABC transport system permease protein